MSEEQSPGFTYPDLRRQSEIEVWQGGICVVLDGRKIQFRCRSCYPSPDQGKVMDENPIVAPEWDRSMTIVCEECQDPIEIIKAAYWPFIVGQDKIRQALGRLIPKVL